MKVAGSREFGSGKMDSNGGWFRTAAEDDKRKTVDVV